MELKLGKTSLWIVVNTLVITILLQTCQFRPAHSVMLYAIYPTHIAEHRFGHPLGIEENTEQIAQMGDGGQRQRLQAVAAPFWDRQSEKPVEKRTAVARLSRFIDAYLSPTLSRRHRRLALNTAAGDDGQLLLEKPIARASANNLRRHAFHRTGGTILLGKRVDEAAQAVPAPAEAETSSSSQQQHDEDNSPLMLLSIVHQPLDGIVVGRRR
uniref:Secreted protein n=1 Tax=Globodera rostochiensis TaxID=31243 RepID=A0A914H9X1_GLORO